MDTLSDERVEEIIAGCTFPAGTTLEITKARPPVTGDTVENLLRKPSAWASADALQEARLTLPNSLRAYTSKNPDDHDLDTPLYTAEQLLSLLPAHEAGLTSPSAETAPLADREKSAASPASGERDAVIEECAKVAEAEELTGDAPSHFTQHEIDIVTATVRSTARSIAAAIRSLRMEGK